MAAVVRQNQTLDVSRRPNDGRTTQSPASKAEGGLPLGSKRCQAARPLRTSWFDVPTHTGGVGRDREMRGRVQADDDSSLFAADISTDGGLLHVAEV
jgi:hypothetical protein